MARAALCLCLAALPVPGAGQALQLFDCNVGYEYWETAWTPDWKNWCCDNHNKGCPITETSTSTVSGTSTTSHTTETWTATSTTDTTSATTSGTATSTTATDTTRPSTTSTRTSRTATSTETSSSTTATTTRTATGTTTATTTTTSPCDKVCLVAGVNSSCRDRIRWTSEHMTKKKTAPCEAAHTLVVSQCEEECKPCSIKASGCGEQRNGFRFRQKFEEAELKGVDAAAGAETPMDRALQARSVLTLASSLILASAAISLVVRAWNARNPRSAYLNLLDHEEDDLSAVEPEEVGEEAMAGGGVLLAGPE